MNYEVETTPPFEKAVKRLRKKYPSIVNDIEELIDSLSALPMQGVALGAGLYKVRLHIASKNTGKSGGGRVITLVKVEETKVLLIELYDKAEIDSISTDELRRRVQSLE